MGNRAQSHWGAHSTDAYHRVTPSKQQESEVSQLHQTWLGSPRGTAFPARDRCCRRESRDTRDRVVTARDEKKGRRGPWTPRCPSHPVAPSCHLPLLFSRFYNLLPKTNTAQTHGAPGGTSLSGATKAMTQFLRHVYMQPAETRHTMTQHTHTSTEKVPRHACPSAHASRSDVPPSRLFCLLQASQHDLCVDFTPANASQTAS